MTTTCRLQFLVLMCICMEGCSADTDAQHVIQPGIVWDLSKRGRTWIIQSMSALDNEGFYVTGSAWPPGNFIAAKYSLAEGRLWSLEDVFQRHPTGWDGRICRAEPDGSLIIAANDSRGTRLLKISTNGSLLWQRATPSWTVGVYWPTELLIHPLGGYILALEASRKTSCVRKTALVKFSKAGELEWEVWSSPNSRLDRIRSVVVDRSGNVYVVAPSVHTGAGTPGFVIRKYSASGSEEWSRRCEGLSPPDTENTVVAADDHGHVFVACTREIGGAPLDSQVVVVRYSRDGIQDWIAAFGRRAGAAETAETLAPDSKGGCYVVGLSVFQDVLVALIHVGEQGNVLWRQECEVRSEVMPEYKVFLGGDSDVFFLGTWNRKANNTDLVLLKYSWDGEQQGACLLKRVGRIDRLREQVRFMSDFAQIAVCGIGCGQPGKLRIYDIPFK